MHVNIFVSFSQTNFFGGFFVFAFLLFDEKKNTRMDDDAFFLEKKNAL